MVASNSSLQGRRAQMKMQLGSFKLIEPTRVPEQCPNPNWVWPERSS